MLKPEKSRRTYRNGKIAALPLAIRNEVNRRLDDAELTSEILAWLNAEPDVRAVLEKRWSGQIIKPGSLTEWCRGGYQDHLRRQERLAQTRESSALAGDAGKPGGTFSSLSADDLEATKLDLDRTKLDLERTKLDLRKQMLEQREKFLDQNRQALELQRARLEHEISKPPRAPNKGKEPPVPGEDDDGDNSAKIELLGKEIFGEAW